jgi:hypothetical protein
MPPFDVIIGAVVRISSLKTLQLDGGQVDPLIHLLEIYWTKL